MKVPVAVEDLRVGMFVEAEVLVIMKDEEPQYFLGLREAGHNLEDAGHRLLHRLSADGRFSPQSAPSVAHLLPQRVVLAAFHARNLGEHHIMHLEHGRCSHVLSRGRYDAACVGRRIPAP